MLEIRGKGIVDGVGLTIDDAKLVKIGTDKNLVINGGFENPPQYGYWNIYDGIEEWKGSHIEIGNGKLYNRRWNSQVCELDSDYVNVVMSQSFFWTVESNMFYLLTGLLEPMKLTIWQVLKVLSLSIIKRSLICQLMLLTRV